MGVIIMGESMIYTDVPDEARGWNWGAFMFSLYWGFGNKAYLALLTLIPIFNIVWIFVCGFKGNEWAWRAGNYRDVQEFKAVQATWNRAGLVYFIILLITVGIFVLLAALGVFAFLFNGDTTTSVNNY